MDSIASAATSWVSAGGNRTADGAPQLVGGLKRVHRAVVDVFDAAGELTLGLAIDPHDVAAQSAGKWLSVHAAQGVARGVIYYLLIDEAAGCGALFSGATIPAAGPDRAFQCLEKA